MSPAPEPDDLRQLGERLDEARHREVGKAIKNPPNAMGIGLRFAGEMVSALIVGGGIGYGLDYGLGLIGLHTKPVFLLIFFVLGSAAGIRNVMAAAKELNEQAAALDKASKAAGDDEER